MASPLSASLMCAFAEQAVQSVLQYDPATRHRLTPLEIQVIHFDISDLSISIYLLFHHNKVTIQTQSFDDVSITIRGNALDLFHLTQTDVHSLANSGVEVSGRIGLLQHFQVALKALNIDWETAIFDQAGPVFGPLISSSLRAQLMLFKQSKKYIQDNTAEILENEFQLIPSKNEMELFINEVDQLQMHVARLQAKIQHLIG